MKERYFTVAALCRSAMIAALYAAMTLALPMASFGMMQFRLSEALTVLPLFFPSSVVGLTLGCAIANLVGFFSGANPIGLIDAVVGSSATLLAALCTAYVGRKIPPTHLHKRLLLGLFPPVIFNAVFVGGELTLLFLDSFWVNFFWVFAGQTAVCYLVGYPLGLAISRRYNAVESFENKM